MNTNVYIVKMMLYTNIKKTNKLRTSLPNRHFFLFTPKKILHSPYETITKK